MPAGVRLLYISPLKALNNDIERNLRAPLEGVRAAAHDLNRPLPELRVAVRTGDTPAKARQAMLKRPPHILITTPESLYLMLTGSRARELFRSVRTVIVDEIHTIAGNKRGVHLALSLERLAHLAADPFQRLGLSATQRPLEEIARFLGGQEWQTAPDGSRRLVPRPVTIVDAGRAKPLDLQVVTVVPDFRELGGSIWPTIEAQVAEQIRTHRTTLVFANSRRLAERLSARLSEQLGEPIRAHHGSTAAAARLQMEADLKGGRLPALVGTSSLELGIDIGSVDLVVQIQSPKGVARGLQRVGRSGHLVGQTSVGRIYTTHREDVMEAAAVAGAMLRGEVEPTRVPENCLDVLAQQIVAAVSVEDWPAAALYDLVRQSYPYRDLPRAAYDEVLAMLAGKYPREIYRELRPRLDWDRAADRLAALPGSAYLATGNAGTIADKGLYAVHTADGNIKIGELDEEFVYELKVGDVFALGSRSWRIERIADDRVIVSDGSRSLPMTPFWRGDLPWRPYELGAEVGRFRRLVAERLQDPGAMAWLCREHALDENSARNVLTYVHDSIQAVGAIASDRTIIVEHCRDALGEPRLVVHSPFGARVNGAWALALRSALRERLHACPEVLHNDDGILLRFSDAEQPLPLDLVTALGPEEARERILQELPDSPLFGAQFRQNAARALLMPRARRSRRTPFFLQRLRAKNLLAATRQFPSFPIIVETYRDCLRDVLDLEHLLELLSSIQRGDVRVVPVERATPSPIAAGLLYQFTAIYMYEWDAPKAERQLHALSVDRDLLQELVQETGLADLLRPQALQEMEASLQRTSADRRARSPEELLAILAELGDLDTSELLARSGPEGPACLETLAARSRIVERAIPTSRGPVRRWILAEEADLYDGVFGPTSPSPYEGEGRGEGGRPNSAGVAPLPQPPITLPSPLTGERERTDPLPQGEGQGEGAVPHEAKPPSQQRDHLTPPLSSRRGSDTGATTRPPSPLPQGEGQGEGAVPHEAK
ncbi:MAG: DEAD/DEAH box helicase, partial [Anaerolineae bacterium]